MKRIKLLLMVVLVFFFVKAPAAEIDATAAQAVAENFLQSSVSGKLRTGVQPSLVLAHAEPAKSHAGMMDYYVFNTSDGKAFVIVSGDDRAEAVLGYGDGAIDMAKLPANMRWWLDQYKRQMECLRNLSADQVAKAPRRSAAEELTVAPLLTCKWSQEKPYNDQCAMYQGARCVTGCVATAMAMVMDYWKFPESLPALPAYSTPTFKIPIEALPGATLDWDNMLDVYSNGYTEAQGAAVATLMRYCSQACMMDCSPEGSSSSGVEQLIAFKKFGYNPAARFVERDSTSAEEWTAMIHSELAAGHPIPYCGRGDGGGHAFVLDGCADGMYHFNWGWGGVCDGYFVLDLLEPYQDYTFSYGQDMNYQVYPHDGSAVSLEPNYDFEADGIYYLKNGNEATVTYKDMSFNSYSGDVEIPETVTHDGQTYQVTAISEYAFAASEGLTSLKIPYIEKIDDYAFTSCPNLHSLTVGKPFKNLGWSSFYGLIGLDRLDVIDIDAFASNNFDSYYANPLVYARRLYHNGEELNDVVIHSAAKRIGNYAFFFCENIKSVTIEDEVESVGEYAFYCCPSLERVEIGAVDTIAMCAFTYNDNLTEVIFHEGLKHIGYCAFYMLPKIKSLVFPASLESIDYAAFAYCDGVESMEFKGGDVAFGEAVFYGCSSMTDLKLSPTQTTVGYATFGECTSLQNLDLGQSLDSIGDYAFYSCPNLSEVSLPVSVSAVGEFAFYGCKRLSQVNISDLNAWCGIDFKNESANPMAYAHGFALNGEAVKDLVIPETVKKINRNAFAGCSSLESVTLSGPITAIGESAFIDCNGLTRVNVNNLENWCAIEFGNVAANPLSSAKHLFVGDDEVTRLVVPASVTSIGKNSFTNCVGLTDVTIGDNVTAVGDRAFNGCQNLVSVTMGDGVKSIGERAFSDCTALMGVSLGSGIESIATKAFSQDMKIVDITCKAQTPPALAAKDCFQIIVYKSASVSVPQASLEAYSAAGFWDQFVHLSGVNFDPAVGDVNRDGEVNVADINAVVNHVLNGGDSSVADVNGDGEISIADVNAVIDEIFNAK